MRIGESIDWENDADNHPKRSSTPSVVPIAHNNGEIVAA